MITITGKYTKANIMTDIVEEDVIKQVTFLCNHPLFKDKPISIMPDTHPGKGTVVGLACKFVDCFAIPALIGQDIGCGMLARKVSGRTINDYKKLDKVVREIKGKMPNWLKLNVERVANRIGTYIGNYEKTFCTLGSGNHFISLEQGEKGTWLITHTGSRNLGKDIYIYYMKKALEENLYKWGEEKQLSWLDKSAAEYYESVLMAQDFARHNAEAMQNYIIKEMKWKVEEEIYCPHNYFALSAPSIAHKGSIALPNLEMGIIPINMADGTFIVQGKGNNEDWLCSAPHGAGRLMSREQAKSSLDMKEYKDKMKNIYSTCVNTSTIDESPMAYKPIEQIKESIEPICEVIDHLKPVYNYKM